MFGFLDGGTVYLGTLLCGVSVSCTCLCVTLYEWIFVGVSRVAQSYGPPFLSVSVPRPPRPGRHVETRVSVRSSEDLWVVGGESIASGCMISRGRVIGSCTVGNGTAGRRGTIAGPRRRGVSLPHHVLSLSSAPLTLLLSLPPPSLSLPLSLSS